MKFLTIPAVLSACLGLMACGEPLSKSQVVSQFSGHTVSKLSSEQRYNHLGPNDPSLGTRYIYHASNGRAYYSKSTPKGYRKKENGRWWAGDNRICYSLRITQAENASGEQCDSAGVAVVWSTFERGDTQRLVPRRTPARTAPKRSQSTSGGVDCTWDIACAIRNTSGGATAAAAVVGGGILLGSAMAKNPSPSTGASSSSRSGTQKAASAGSAGATVSGFKITSRETYGIGQDVIARGFCNKGGSFRVRYYPDQPSNKSHSIDGFWGRSVEDVASKRCR